MKYLIELVKIFFSDIRHYLSQRIKLAAAKTQNPTCIIYRGAKLNNTTLSNYNVVFEDTAILNSYIGSHTYIQKKSTVFNAHIGKFCSIASKVSIGPGIHKIEGASTHPAFFSNTTPLPKTFSRTEQFTSFKQTNIGHDVWIGENVIILDGLTIGTGAVIASGAVVTKDVPPYAIVAGIPAKHIKFRFSNSEIQMLLESKWWDRSESWLQENHAHFNSISEFAKII